MKPEAGTRNFQFHVIRSMKMQKRDFLKIRKIVRVGRVYPKKYIYII